MFPYYSAGVVCIRTVLFCFFLPLRLQRNAIGQHSFHSHTHRVKCVHTSTCHIKTWPYKQRYICRCVCVCLRVMWYHDPHPDVREGPVNIQRHQECETHEATDLPLLLTQPQPQFVPGVPEREKTAHSITLMPTRQT